MTKANVPPLTLGQIIDRIEQTREELFILQKSLEQMELAEPPAPKAGAAHGIKNV